MTGGGTLVDVLVSAARDAPEQLIVEVGGDGSERAQTYRQLLDDSRLVAGGYQAAGLAGGSPVILLPGGTDDFLPSFWGALLAGLVPVPMAPDPDKVLTVWSHLGRPTVVVDDLLEPLVRRLLPGDADPLRLSTVAGLRAGTALAEPHRPDPQDVAFLQFSSGSTGEPKGVELTHANVVANIDQTVAAGAATSSDVIASWLPYFHDMGLIGAHLAPLAVRIKQVKLDPADFGKRPGLWYAAATRHRATLLPMASFALALTLKRVPAEQVATFDLSAVRMVGVGAEPIPVRSWRQFAEHLRPAELDPRAMMPLYGLAEATVAVAFPPAGELSRPLVLVRSALAEGRAVDAGPADASAAEFMDVGSAVPGGELRVVNDDDHPLADSRIGHVQFRGPNVARGYHGRPDETARTFVDGWLRTGDVGFLRDGRLCVTGRAKDVLFVNGRKHSAHDIEQVVATTPGVPSGRVAVVGVTDPVTGGERVVVFVPSAAVDAPTGLLIAVRARVREALAYDDVRVLSLPARDFPRTTSGKLRRATLRERYAAGDFAAAEADAALACTPDPALVAHPPRHEVEARITAIWAEALGVPPGSIHREDRFLSIGGTSVTAMHVLSLLEDAFDGPLEPAVLRDCATVAALAEHLLGRAPVPASTGRAPAGRPTGDADGAGDAAVIALACRFPDADTPEQFWDNLLAGRDSVTSVPGSRWPTCAGPARWGGFLDDVAGFDADYFGIDAAEADVMDPHARVFLEVAHEALERAGYAGQRRRSRRIGVFVAVGESDYPRMLHQTLDDGAEVSPAALVGNLRNLIAARVSQCLDLSGPALAIDTACSSSLAALHLARRSLAAGECDVAVVGGVSLNLAPTPYRLLEAAQALSPTGRCRAFSQDADGFVPGEGAAALVLEPLTAAMEGGDRVLAVVRGSAMNNDGRSLSLMAPNPLLQEEVIADAYREAGIDPVTVGYVEAHGTGTAVGDPIEARSLARTFPPAPAQRPRWLGSVKTNVGHLLNAAGMPSLLKVVLALRHRRLPASLNYAGPSPQFDLAAAGFQVVTQTRQWTRTDGPLRAGINGFGFGGTNVHVILEEAPPDVEPGARTSVPGPHLLRLSAASEEALRAAATDLARYARSHPHTDEADLCDAVATARDDGPHRLAVVVDDDLAARLEASVATRAVGSRARRRPRVVWMFPGQGAQVPGMARAHHASQPAYRRMLTDLSRALGPVQGRSLLDWSLDSAVDPADLAGTAVAQPLLVAHAIALAHQLDASGVRPDAVVGHSVGELAAAAVAGALDPQAAVRFAAERGRLVQEHCAAGAMAWVRGAEADVHDVVSAAAGRLSLAAVNGPAHFVLSGPEDDVDAAVSGLAVRGCRVGKLAVSRAFHSPMMAPVLEPLGAVAQELTISAMRIPLLSTVTAQWTSRLDAAYFCEHASRPVQFGAAVRRLLDEGYDTFVELGPEVALAGLVRAGARAGAARADVEVLAVADGDRGDALTRTVGRLWVRGVSVIRPGTGGGRLRPEVPTYPFQRTHHWLPTTAERRTGQPAQPAAQPAAQQVAQPAAQQAAQQVAQPAAQPAAQQVAEPVSPLLHRITWSDAPLPAGAVLRSVRLVGADDDPATAKALRDRLTRRGVRVDLTPRGQVDDVRPVDVLVVLCAPAIDLDDVRTLDALTRRDTATLLQVARLLHDRPTPLVVVTEDVALTNMAVERARPGHAILTGLAMALAEEGVDQPVRVVDLSSLDEAGARLDALVRELDAPATPGPTQRVAWRDGRRLAVAPVPDEALPAEHSPPLPTDGCYLVTGGTGGVGAEISRLLARRGCSELVLVGRSPTCPPSLLAELRDLGAIVRYVAADLTVEPDVERLVAGLSALDAVVHAAGVMGVGRLRSQSTDDVAHVLGPKVRGSFLLARAIERHGLRPGTVVAVSSIASALPGYAGGLGAYAAASCFLDAFGLAETRAGRPVQVLNFAAWADTGMAATPAFRTVASVKGVPVITTGQALQALLDATTRTEAQLLVLPATRPPTAENARVATLDGAEPVRAPARDSSGGSVRDLIAAMIAAELGLGPDELDHEASFLRMGLDSLTAVDLVKSLEIELQRALPTTLLFEHSSVTQLAAYLSQTDPGGGIEQPDTAPDGGVDDAAPFPLTPVQRAFHTSGRLHPQVAAYACLRQQVAGPLDEAMLARSLGVLEQRHPMLRLRIHADGSSQHIEPATEGHRPAWFRTIDLDGPVEAVEDELCNRVFRTDGEPPVRGVLLRETADRAWLILVLHHAAADGASLHLLVTELWQVYTALVHGRAPQLRPLPTGFSQHAADAERQLASDAATADRRHWGERLAAAPPPACLPYDGEPDAEPTAQLSAQQFSTSAGLTDALRARAAEQDVSLFHLVLAAYATQLARWCGQQDITIDVARAGRDSRLPDIDSVIGPFADTLPLTVRAVGGSGRLAKHVRDAWLECEQRGRVSTLDLARMLPTVDATPRTAGTAAFSFARFPLEAQPDCPVTVTSTAARTASAATRLGLLCWEFAGALQFSWNHPASVFTPATVARFTDDLLEELAALAAPSGNRERAHRAGPLVIREPATVASLASRIAHQCRSHPEAVAVQSVASRLTYGELGSSAHRLAARLRCNGVRAGDRVVLLTGAGTDTVVGLLGILRAGAAWVPLDAAHPLPRLADQAQRSGASAVVCDDTTAQAACRLGLPVLDLTATETRAMDGRGEVLPDATPAPDDVAYVIFTSGTSGRPKGVPITHAALTTYLDWAIDTFGYDASDRLVATASICFDASVRQLLAPLLVGATVVAAPSDVVRDPQALLALVERERVTVWSSVPTLWEHLLQAAERRAGRGAAPDLAALRWVHVGGEALSPSSVRRWYDLLGPAQRVVNLYGPTEATINATYHIIDIRPADDETVLPIGQPVAGTVIDVVGPDGRSCAPGQPGELLLAGPRLTPGYLDDDGSDAFVVRAGLRHYRTGDRVVQRADGLLEFRGRIDRQVKIRGHRVEPDEVEATLACHPAVLRATVVATEDDAARHVRLVAHVELRESTLAPEPEELRGFLAERLPDYLVPARIRVVETTPLTVTGKVDASGLASATRGRRGSPPGTSTERLLAEVWGEVLDVDAVCRDDDFFALGGDSIAVLEVFARLEPRVPALPAPTTMYRTRTLAGLAEAIDATVDARATDAQATDPRTTGTHTVDAPPAVAWDADVSAAGAGTDAPFELTPAQRGFLLAEALAPGARGSWLGCVRLTGALDAGLFQQAVDQLVERHLMLRVRIGAGARPPVQQEVPSPARVPVQLETIRPDELARHLAVEREHRFDTSGWPLLRLRLLRLGAEEHALVVHAHHLIGDGLSVTVLARDLLALYDELATGRPAALPPLRSTFRDYARLLSAAPATRPSWNGSETYVPPRRKASPAAAGAVPPRADFLLDKAATDGLRRLASGQGTTAFAPMLTGYYRALRRLTGQDDLLLGVAVTGRDHALPDITRLVGPFATVAPVLLRDTGNTVPAQVRAVARAVDSARADGATLRQRVDGSPMQDGVSALGAQLLFSYLDFGALGPVQRSTLRLSWETTDLEPPPLGTDLLMTVRPVDGGMRITLRSSPDALPAADLDTLAGDLHRDLVAMSSTARPTRPAACDVLDAALVGYLPSPVELARLAGLPFTDNFREAVRAGLFPDGQPRLLEELATPLGRSGFICLPVFADELRARTTLAGEVAGAVGVAAGMGAHCVSLAGLIPACTAYGFDVLRDLGEGSCRVTTGHATTAASVVRTTLSALAAARRDLADVTMACVGLGSIGRSSLELLLALDAGAPRMLVLCDVPARANSLVELARALRAGGFTGEIATCVSDPSVPVPVLEADVVVAATSSAMAVLDVGRLRPGAVVVDDSFPHCFDAQAAVRRMQQRRDVLVVGGGLLRCSPTTRRSAVDLPHVGDSDRLLSLRLPDTVASCQLESLLQAAHPDLPLVHGLVDVPLALCYWHALGAAGVNAAPLHLAQHVIDTDDLLDL